MEDVHELHVDPLNSPLHLLKLTMDRCRSTQPRLAEKNMPKSAVGTLILNSRLVN